MPVDNNISTNKKNMGGIYFIQYNIVAAYSL